MSRTFRRINSKHILDQKLEKLKNKYFSNLSNKKESTKTIIKAKECLNNFFRDSLRWREKRGCICVICAPEIIYGKKYKMRKHHESFSKNKVYDMVFEYYDLIAYDYDYDYCDDIFDFIY